MSFIFSCTMFFLSFTPLWLSIVFIDAVSIWTNQYCIWTEIISICCIVVVFFISGIMLHHYLQHGLVKGNRKYTVLKAKEEKTISVEFILSYVMPLFAFDFKNWQQTILFLHIFLILGWLSVKHNHFSNNVVLEALGYRVFHCVLDSEDRKQLDVNVITKDNMVLSLQEEVTIEFVNNDFAITR